jgi:hypothetical protein
MRTSLIALCLSTLCVAAAYAVNTPVVDQVAGTVVPGGLGFVELNLNDTIAQFTRGPLTLAISDDSAMLRPGDSLSLTASGTHPGTFLVRCSSLLIDTPMNNLAGNGFMVGTFIYDGGTNQQTAGLLAADVHDHTQVQAWLVGDPDWGTGALTSQTLVASLSGEFSSSAWANFSGSLNGFTSDANVTSAQYAVHTAQVVAPRSSDCDVLSETKMLQFVPPDGSADFSLPPTGTPPIALEVNMSHSGTITGGGLGVMPGRFEIDLFSFVVIDPDSPHKDEGYTAGTFFMSDFAEQGTISGVVLGNLAPDEASSRIMDALLFSTSVTGTFKGLFLYGSLKGEFSETTSGGEFGAFRGTLTARYYNESREYGAGFDTGSEGWTTGGAPLFFSMPGTDAFNGQILLISTTNTNTFGFWQSPDHAFSKTTDTLYQATCLVKTNLFTPATVPTVRLRLAETNNQTASVFLIESANTADCSPSPLGTSYQTYLLAPTNVPTDLYMAFDMLNFDPDNAPYATLGLDNVIIEKRGLSNLPAFSTEQTITFDDSEEGWSFVTVEPTFSAPENRFTTGSLEIASTSNLDNFGFWVSPVFPLEDGKIYRIDFTVRTDIVPRALVPTIRLRMNTNNLQESCALVITSADNAESSPTPAGMTYSLYFIPPESAISGPLPGMILAFDLLNFGGIDAETGSLFLDTVTINSADRPIM